MKGFCILTLVFRILKLRPQFPRKKYRNPYSNGRNMSLCQFASLKSKFEVPLKTVSDSECSRSYPFKSLLYQGLQTRERRRRQFHRARHLSLYIFTFQYFISVFLRFGIVVQLMEFECSMVTFKYLFCTKNERIVRTSSDNLTFNQKYFLQYFCIANRFVSDIFYVRLFKDLKTRLN